MIQSKLMRFLCSIPMILLFLYFIPFLGVCLLIARLFVYRKKNKTSFILIALGIIILLPNILENIFKLIKFDSKTIPYFYDLIYLDIYNMRFIPYAKLLLTVGIIFIILSYIANMLLNKATDKIKDYIRNEENMEREIREKNDLVMQDKREKAKNTHVVVCPYCGADNILTSNHGKCKFCRRTIQSKDK